MSDDYLVRHCVPTLAGLKTGSLFTCPFSCRKMLLNSVRRMNKRLVSKGYGFFLFALRTRRR